MARDKRPEPAPGVVVLDKPAGWTSHDVVAKCRGLYATRKVGHAGTLDPMATGVLVLGIGKGTRLLTYIVGADKDYDATIRLGQSTITDDAEGDVTGGADATAVTDEQISAAISDLTGDIQQVPSSVSAIKVDGKRSYARVRGGEDVQLEARPVTVSRFEVRAVRREGAVVDVDVAVTVSSGTYVRALARDLGDALGVGGHLTALRRTRVGGFELAEATTLDAVQALVDAGDTAPRQSLGDAAQRAMPAVVVSEAARIALGHGKRPPLRDAVPAVPADAADEATFAAHGDLAALSGEGTLVAIVKVTGGALVPQVVFEGAG